MSITYTPDPANLAEVAVAVEPTYGTIQDPTVANGGVQIATAAPPEFGRGHQPIEGAALTSTVQQVLTHAAIRGIELPFVNFESALSANSINTLLYMLTGSALSANEWAIANDSPGFTVGVNVQRPGATGGDYFGFVGSKVGAGRMVMPLGGQPTLRLECLARTLKNPDTSPTSFPTLAPTTTYRPFILTDCSLRHATATGAPLTGATAVKIKGFEMAFDMGLLVEHNSSATHPDSITRTAFRTSGTINARFSAEWWDEWKAIVATESSGGYVSQYIQMLLQDGTNTLRIVCPVKLELPGARADGLAFDASLSFIAAGDDTADSGGAPTTAVFKVRNA